MFLLQVRSVSEVAMLHLNGRLHVNVISTIWLRRGGGSWFIGNVAILLSS